MGVPADGQVLNANIRGPLSFTRTDDGRLVAARGGGGVVSALSSALGTGDTLWICAALNDADRAQVRKTTDGRLGLDGAPGGSGVRMLDIPAATFRRAHNGVANSTLWFVHHMLYDTPNLPRFGPKFEREWESYRAYNRAFADALAEEAAPPPDGGAAARGAVRAVVHDYHLSLVPRMLADARPDVRIAHFSHTPWAPPDYFRLLPTPVGREVLEGVLGADHAGFHCQRWADAFLECCRAILGADVDRVGQRVSHRGHVTSVGVHPLGVDTERRSPFSFTICGIPRWSIAFANPVSSNSLRMRTRYCGGWKILLKATSRSGSQEVVRMRSTRPFAARFARCR